MNTHFKVFFGFKQLSFPLLMFLKENEIHEIHKIFFKFYLICDVSDYKGEN